MTPSERLQQIREAERRERAAMTASLAKDLIALFAVTVFLIALAGWAPELHNMIGGQNV